MKLGKKHIIALVAVLVLLLGGGFIAYTLLVAPSSEEKQSQVKEEEKQPDSEGSGGVFLEMDEFMVNLRTGQKRTRFLKLNITLELDSEKEAMEVKKLTPKIRDAVHAYIRGVRFEDLRGPRGVHHLKRRLFTRIARVLQPSLSIREVLITDILTQ